jgi:putative acetyltransferase
MNIELRLEKEDDYFEVESITREAFWNLHSPGCNEHFLAHVMRSHGDFIKELDFVAIVDNKIVGNIMYTKSLLLGPNGLEIPIVSFGPVSVLPEYQRHGIGGLLIRKTIEIVRERYGAAIVIWGNPNNYVSFGFRTCKDYNISAMENKFPTCLLVLELKPGIIGKEFLLYRESEVYQVNENEAEKYDELFEKKEKGFKSSQEEFKILSRSFCD